MSATHRWGPTGIVGLLSVFGIVAALMAQTARPNADLVFHNGKILTVDADFSVRQAFAVRGDRFIAVGTDAEILALADRETRVVDLEGRTVIPGLMDNHNHQYRAASRMSRGLNMLGVSSLAEMLDRIETATVSASPGETVLVGGGWNPADFPENRPPSRLELDEAAPRHPVMVIRSRRQVLLNTAALNAVGIDRNTESVAGVPIPRDVSGDPTGVIDQEPAVNAVTAELAPLTQEENKDLILTAQQDQNALGLTSIRELALAPDVMRAYWDLWREERLTLRVSMGLATTVEELDDLEDRLRFFGVGPGFGDHWLRLDCVAEFGLDTGIDVALVRNPLDGEHENPFGVQRMTPEKLRDSVLLMHRYGWRPSIHLVGDRALDIALDAYEAADQVSPIAPRRWVVEHIYMVQPDQMERLARLGVLVSAQIQPYQNAEEMLEHWGRERAERAVPIRELLDHQLVVSSGTDWPARNNNPFLTIYFYVTRKTEDGSSLGVAQQISREEALRMATVNNAYMTFEESVKGSIETDKLADFLILSEDLMTVPEARIPSLRPVATYVGGRRVFSTPEGNSY